MLCMTSTLDHPKYEGYFSVFYTVGLTSLGQKVREHNNFIYLLYIYLNCKKFGKSFGEIFLKKQALWPGADWGKKEALEFST